MKWLATSLFVVFFTQATWAESPVDFQEQPETTEQKLEIESPDKEQEVSKALEVLIKRFDKDEELTEEERKELKEALMTAKEAIKEIDNITIDLDSEDSFMGNLVGLFAILLIFGGPIIIVAIALYSSYKKRRLTHQTINAYIEQGKDIPAEVLKGLQQSGGQKSNLHKGLVMVGVGVGLALCFGLIGSTEAAALGLIPLFIGVALLLVWKLEKKSGQTE
ncbi:DUF6249 domain-containing protein [Porticoccaceae bacterium LTM1]|nr:DUF6249 domain-containing protein [Porticoccaceae bacterium LTM1]